MKKNNRGYILAEALIVTAFVASVMVYLCVQLTNLSASYEKSQSYNTVPGLYALSDVIYFINKNSDIESLISSIDSVEEICVVTNTSYCTQFNYLIVQENIKTLLISKNDQNTDFSNYNGSLKDFIDTISFDGAESYRLIAEFNNETFASLKFNINVGGNS